MSRTNPLADSPAAGRTRYNPLKGAIAISRASFRATCRSPPSLVFSVLFPVIFIVVFGAMVDTTAVRIRVDLDPESDTSGMLFSQVRKISILDLRTGNDPEAQKEDLLKGRTSAILFIRKGKGPPGAWDFLLETSSSSADRIPILRAAFAELVAVYNRQFQSRPDGPAVLRTSRLPGRQYRKIDFILPGQLGFSLLMAGVFGSTFLLFNLRQSHVLKRISATPLSRGWVVLGELLSRFIFQLLTFVVIVGLGYWVFHFTLVHGIWTFLEMLLVSIPGLIIFMGTGFIISGMIRSESSIAPVANTIILPQILLCGLFFPVSNYPTWLQDFCNLLPLTFYVDSLRHIAFEGMHFWQLPRQWIGLGCWTGLTIWLAIRLFRWE